MSDPNVVVARNTDKATVSDLYSKTVAFSHYNTLSEQLRQELEAPAQNLWIELDLLWEDLEYGLALEAFHLGYRAALHTLKAAVGHDAVTGMLHDILLTEYDQGVLRTSLEQERMDAAAPPEE